MILLPPNPQRAWLRSFWAAACLLGTILIGILAWLYGTRWLWLTAAIGVLFAAGMITPRWLVWPYRAWNKLGRLYAGLAETLVLRISFFTVCVPAGWAGSRMQVKRPPLGGTLWLSRKNGTSIDKSGPVQKNNGKPAGNWVARYIAWAKQSQEIWRLALLPFLLVLAALQSEEQESTVPDNIYTLF